MIKRSLHRWHGVGLTALALGAIHAASGLMAASLSLAFVPLVYTAYHHGLRPALFSALLVVGYALYALPPDRAAQIAIAALAIAVPMGILKRRARFTESINGNLAKAREIKILARFLIDHRRQMNDGLVFRFLEEIEDRAGQLETLVWGWQQIRQEALEAEEKLKHGLLKRAELEMDDGGQPDDPEAGE
jgi:hypothetical protein